MQRTPAGILVLLLSMPTAAADENRFERIDEATFARLEGKRLEPA